MGNGRSMKRKMSGRSGHSPSKSQRKARQRQAAAWRMKAALANMSTMATDLLENVGPLADMAKEKMGESQPDVPTEEGPEGEGG